MGQSRGSVGGRARAALTRVGHRVAVLQRRAVLALQRHVTLADAGGLAARARGLGAANQLLVRGLGAALSGAVLEVRHGVGVGTQGAVGVALREEAHAILQNAELGLWGAALARRAPADCHRHCNTDIKLY